HSEIPAFLGGRFGCFYLKQHNKFLFLFEQVKRNSLNNPKPVNARCRCFGFHQFLFGSRQSYNSCFQRLWPEGGYPKRKSVFRGNSLYKQAGRNLLYFEQKQVIANRNIPASKFSILCGLRLVFLYREYTSCLLRLG